MVRSELDNEVRNKLRQEIALAKRSNLGFTGLIAAVNRNHERLVDDFRDRLNPRVLIHEVVDAWRMTSVEYRSLDRLLRFEQVFQRVHNNSING